MSRAVGGAETSRRVSGAVVPRHRYGPRLQDRYMRQSYYPWYNAANGKCLDVPSGSYYYGQKGTASTLVTADKISYLELISWGGETSRYAVRSGAAWCIGRQQSA